MGNHASSPRADHICPEHSLDENASEPLFGSTSFYDFNVILSGSCAAFACLVIFALMFMHATHLSKPNEQIKIMKISILIPFYSIFSFLSVCYPAAQVYLDPWLDFFQAIALCSFFLLMCEFVSPSEEKRNVFFAALEVTDKKAPSGKGGGLIWFRRKWILMFQYPVVATAAAIATDITQSAGVYCEYLSKPYFAHIWISIAQSVSIVLAVSSVYMFYKALKTHLAQHKPLTKLLAFKLIVLVTFVEKIIFWILRDTSALTPTSKLDFADLNIGIPSLIICTEMVPFSIFFAYAYDYRPYIIHAHSAAAGESAVDSAYTPSYQGGCLGIRAWLVMWNPSEILSAIVFAFKMVTEERNKPQQQGHRGGGGRYTGFVPLEYGRE